MAEQDHGDELDAEGVPDLDGAEPGDPTAHEGMIPPRAHKQAPDDYWHQDTLEERLREEVPDRVRGSDGAESCPRGRLDRRVRLRRGPGRLPRPAHHCDLPSRKDSGLTRESGDSLFGLVP